MSVVARRILITLVVLVLLLVVADRVGVYLAEKAAGDALQKSQHLDSKPEVDIGGFPFLTQLASRHFDEITVKAKNVSVGGGSALPISTLTVVLHTVTVSRSFSSFHADRANATARISYADLSHALKSTVTYVSNGRIRARASVTVLGRTVAGSLTARPRFQNGALGFEAPAVDGAGGLAAGATQALNRIFDVHLPLTDVPFHVRVTALQATKDGLQLQLAGTNLSYTKS